MLVGLDLGVLVESIPACARGCRREVGEGRLVRRDRGLQRRPRGEHGICVVCCDHGVRGIASCNLDRCIVGEGHRAGRALGCSAGWFAGLRAPGEPDGGHRKDRDGGYRAAPAGVGEGVIHGIPDGRVPVTGPYAASVHAVPGPNRESRDQILARVLAEQDGLHPDAGYSRTARRRVWLLGAVMVPVSVLIGWAIGAPLGWSPFLWVATGLGISLGVFYIAYVILAERDDGRIQRELDDARRRRASGEGEA